jgi:hypothetical protein
MDGYANSPTTFLTDIAQQDRFQLLIDAVRPAGQGPFDGVN